jgi:hypothetical protein
MRSVTPLRSLAFAWLLCALTTVSIAQNGDDVMFAPPEEGAPGDRVGAGTRGSLRKSMLTLLTPKGGGQTAEGSPMLAWHLSEQFAGSMRLVLKEPGRDRPWLVLEEQVSWPGGLYGVSLADFGLTIEPGNILEWTLTLSPRAGEPPAAEASSFIERTDDIRRPAGSDMRTMAARGLWYDALAKGVELTEPGEIRVLAPDALASLLKSAGLPRLTP